MKNRIYSVALIMALFAVSACTVQPPTAPAGPSQPTEAPMVKPTREATKEATAAPLTMEALENAEYQGIYDEPVQLTAGKYEGEPFVEGGASRPTVTLTDATTFGDLDGDGIEDAAVVLVESSGGTGNFRYLAVVINHNGNPKNVATTLLGDRVKIESLSIELGEITVQMTAHGPDDPMCCPSQEVTQRYTLQGGELIQMASEETIHPLEGTTWILVGYGPPDNPMTPLAETEITAEFADGQVNGSAGCNRYFAGYQIDDQLLNISQVAQTEMACLEDGVMEQEAAYLAALRSAQSFAIDGDTLTIPYAGGVLRFTAMQPVADVPLENTRWQLTSFGAGDTVQSLISGTEITAEFSDGKVNGSAGCNRYFADYTLEGEAITFGEIGATRMACPAEIMAQENDFFAALKTAKSFTINGDTLTMNHANGTLIFKAQTATSS